MVSEYVHINTLYSRLQPCTVHIKITVFTYQSVGLQEFENCKTNFHEISHRPIL